MKQYKTTGKLGTADREYRIHKSGELQTKDQAGGWFASHHSMKSFQKMIRLGGVREIK